MFIIQNSAIGDLRKGSESRTDNRVGRFGFTIVEVLIAITLSLLLMLSLTQAFKFLSDRIRENRTRVELSTRLNSVINLIESDLRALTVPLSPQTEQSESEGYFVYYEGPTTDASSILFGGQPSPGEGAEYYRDSRFGDFDDYLAFTAYNPSEPFRGFVPKYILLANSDPSYDLNNLTAEEMREAIEPVAITSHYAEIIYWVRPALVTESGTDGLGGTGPILSYDNLGSVISADLDLDNFPDGLVLHRRVLLIRPDLNSAAGVLPQLRFPTGSTSYVFMQPDPWPVETGAGTLPQIIRSGPAPFGDQRQRSWQIGMAPIHQQCDLSVRWVLDANGMPTGFNAADNPRAAANSLAELTQPHNRFAHVRAPAAAVGFPAVDLNGFTTMPILAVGSQLPYLTNAASGSAPATSAAFAPSLRGAASGLQSAFNGFLRPEFALGVDYTHTEVPGTFWGRERLGDDVLSTEVLAFDIQAFDDLAPVVVWAGPDGAPGTAGLDDDGNGTTDNVEELGSPNSDDVIASPSDPIFFQVARSTPVIASRGDFVDLTYDRLAGGAFRNFGVPLRANMSSSTTSPPASGINRNLVGISSLSGFRDSTPVSVLNSAELPLSLLQSGRVLINGNGIRLFQPVYDTFTTDYERDGRLQFDANRNAVFNNPLSVFRQGTVWWLPHPTLTQAMIDRGANGIDNLSGSGLVAGVDSWAERETSAPFESPISAFRIRIRLQDQASGAIQQQTVVSDTK